MNRDMSNDLKGKYKDVPIRDLILMLKEMCEITPDDIDEITEVRQEIARRKIL